MRLWGLLRCVRLLQQLRGLLRWVRLLRLQLLSRTPGPDHLISGGEICEVLIAEAPMPHFFRIRS